MSAEIVCRSLQFQPPEALAIAAGCLLNAEFRPENEQQLVSAEEAGSRYLSRLMPDIEALYAATRSEAGLLAASHVIHNSGLDGYTTYVAYFAVRPNRREHGYGRRLMWFIGHQALLQGDDQLDLYTDIPSYFVGSGFKTTGVIEEGDSQTHQMSASVRDVLSAYYRPKRRVYT